MTIAAKCLLIKRGAIGDLLLATAFIRQLKQTGAFIDILVGNAAAAAIKDNPAFQRVIIVPDAYFDLRGAGILCCTLLKLRYYRYDYVFILDKHWYFALMSWCLKAKRVGYYRQSWQRWLLHYAVQYHDITRYHALYYLDLLAASNISSPNYQDISLDIVINAADENYVNHQLLLRKIIQYIVVINSGGNNSYEHSNIRALPQQQIITLISKLAITHTIILLGSKQDYSEYNKMLQHLQGEDHIYNLAGLFSLAQSTCLLRQAIHVYTTDCGALHLAVASGKTQNLTVFCGPTNPQHILPVNLLKHAIWCDQHIYDPRYQLTGKLPKQIKFFSQILQEDKIIC